MTNKKNTIFIKNSSLQNYTILFSIHFIYIWHSIFVRFAGHVSAGWYWIPSGPRGSSGRYL